MDNVVEQSPSFSPLDNPLWQEKTTQSIIPVLDQFKSGQRLFTIKDEGLSFDFELSETIYRNIEPLPGWFQRYSQEEPHPSLIHTLPELLYVRGFKVLGASSHSTVSFETFSIPTIPTSDSSWASELSMENTRINQNPCCSSGLLTVAHEEGHIESFRRMYTHNKDLFKRHREAIEKAHNKEKITPEQIALIVQEERFAWSYALNKLRKLISRKEHPLLTLPNIQAYIHDIALDSYNTELASLITEQL